VNPREDLRAIHHAAVASAHAEQRLLASCTVASGLLRCAVAGRAESVPLPDPAAGARVLVVGAGKAVASMARGIERVLGTRIAAGLVITKQGHREDLQRIAVREAGHPVPDAAGRDATSELLGLLGTATRNDLVIVLLSGGASSLLVAPAAGLSLADKMATHAALVRSGADIRSVNIVRKHLSSIKGGQLALAANGARVLTLLLSDVLGDDPATIGSGPTVPDPSTYSDALQVLDRYDMRGQVPSTVLQYLCDGRDGLHPETPKEVPGRTGRAIAPLILASNSMALMAAADTARGLGYEVTVCEHALTGDNSSAASLFARRVEQLAQSRAGSRPRLLLGGGEMTVRVTGGGRGGRCQEFALRVALQLKDRFRWSLLAAGTDGTDGPTDAAGAYADDTTCARASAMVLAQALADNDCYPVLAQLGDLLRTGPTGTNVLDVFAAIVP
jgi:glycerate-2-kinase